MMLPSEQGQPLGTVHFQTTGKQSHHLLYIHLLGIILYVTIVVVKVSNHLSYTLLFYQGARWHSLQRNFAGTVQSW